jgi:hypothetical protein
MPSVIDVTLTVGQPSYVTSRYPSMVRIQYPLIPPQPAGFEVNSTNFLVPLIHFDLPPDTRDIFGILIQDKRTLIAHKVTLVSDTVGDNRDMKISGQDVNGNYIEEVLMLNGTTAVTSVKTYNWILWVTSFYGTVLNEVPTPPTDGTSTVFTVANQPVTGSVQVYIDSVAAVLGIDYTTTGSQIMFVNPPVNGSQIQISYIYELFPNANVRISAPATIGVLMAGALQWLSNPILYRYEDLSFGGSNSDPALTFAYNNPTGATTHEFLVYFYNILDELSLPLDINQPNLFTPPVSNIDCLDVRNSFHGIPGATGDGITNDTASVQSALDQASENYKAIQAALLAKTAITGIGSTKVCIPAGVVCAVGGNFWRGAQGLAWPHSPATGVFSQWLAAVYMRSGVTLQLDGELLQIPDGLAGFGSVSCCIGCFDNDNADKHVTGTSIIGGGLIDGQETPTNYPLFSSLGRGLGIYAIVKQGSAFSVAGTLTIQNYFGTGIVVVDAVNPTIEYPMPIVGFTAYNPTLPVPVGTVNPSASITGCSVKNCGGNPPYSIADSWAAGGIYVSGYGITIEDCQVLNAQNRFGIYVAGATILVQNCRINGTNGFVSLYIDACLNCQILENSIDGVLAVCDGIETRATGFAQPTANINWLDTLTISGNQIKNCINGIQFATLGLINHLTPWYRINVIGNTCVNNSGFGLTFDDFSAGTGQFVNVVLSKNVLNGNTIGQLHLSNGGTDTLVPIPGLSVDHPDNFTQAIVNGSVRNFGAITETPAGAINGANKVFTLVHAPKPTNSLHLYLYRPFAGSVGPPVVPATLGSILLPTNLYSLAGSTITFGTAPVTGDVITAIYNY